MIFPALLIDEILRGHVTATIRPRLPGHHRLTWFREREDGPLLKRGGPYRAYQRLAVIEHVRGDIRARIELTDIEETTIGELDVDTIRKCGFRRCDGQRSEEARERVARDQLAEHWMSMTATQTPPKPDRQVWLLTFNSIEVPTYLAPATGYTRDARRSIDVDETVGFDGREVRVPIDAVPGAVTAAFADDADRRRQRERAGELTMRELNSAGRRLQRVREILAAKDDVDLLSDAARLSAVLSDIERRADAA